MPDPSVISLYGKRVLLLHGDSLCTTDKTYQLYRAVSRHYFTQKVFLSLPYKFRANVAQSLRQLSQTLYKKRAEPQRKRLADVTPNAVNDALHKHHVTEMIHGHTHVAKVDNFSFKEHPARRTVLGSWSKERGSVLVYSKDSQQLEEFC